MSKTASPKKTFKQYYDEDPEFRKRHLQRMLEKVPCECGFVTRRNNLSKHRKSRNHEKRMETKKLERNVELENLKKAVAKLERQMKRQKKKMI